MYRELPIKVQVIPYRINEGVAEVLLMKRSPEDGGFWNTVAGTLELNESLIECRARELQEETGIVNVIEWTGELHRFTFPKQDYEVVVLVYGAHVSLAESVVLNGEHTDYQWVEAREAVNVVEKDNVKNCLNKFIAYIQE